MTPLVELFRENLVFFVVVALILGLLVGSFLNVLIYRLPVMIDRQWRHEAQVLLGQIPENHTPFNLLEPDSRCPHCGHAIRAWENIPVLSFLILRGKCSQCKASISLRYPLVELVTGLLTAWVAWHFGFGRQAGCMMLLTWGFVAMILIDADHQLLPDSLTFPLLWLGLLVNSFGLFVPLVDAVWGAAAGYLSLWCVYWAFRLLTGKEGMGFGDFKLLALIGAWGGWQVLPATILLSSIVGAVVGIILVSRRSGESGTAIPFGPYLATAGWIALLWGGAINAFYLQSAGLA